MPHIFLSEEAITDLQDHVSHEINSIQEQIKSLEKNLYLKKAIWNDLGNKVILPLHIETDYTVVDDAQDINEHRIPGDFEAIDNTHSRPDIPGHGRIMPQKIGKIPDALKDIAKISMEDHEEKTAQKETAKDTKIEKPLLPLTKADPKPEEKHNRWAGVQYLQKDDVLIPKFQFDKDKKQFYKNIFFVEVPDGRVGILYGESTYCTTKARVMGIPYPFPVSYFDSKRGWNSTVEQAIKKYRMYLAEEAPIRKKALDEKADPDRQFKPFGLNNTRVGKEDFEKVEGELE